MAKTNRILFCTDTWPPQVNGVSVVTALSASGLARRGWECAVVAPRYPAVTRNPFAGDPSIENAVSTAASIPSIPIPSYPDLRFAAPARGVVDGIVRRFRPNVVHCATEFVVGWLGQRTALRHSLPVTSSYHTDFSRYTEAYGAGWARDLVRRYIARFHRRSAFTLTPSVPAARDLEETGVSGVRVWGRGVDTDTFHPGIRSEALRRTYGQPGTFIFLHVGRIAAEKGVDRIISAFDIVRQQLPAGTVHLVIAGSGPLEHRLRLQARHGVTFLGNLDRHSVLPRLYASCDAFAFASHTETLGLVILEAMSSGLPVIAAPEGGVADHLRDGINGLTYPAGDIGSMARAMVALVLDRQRTATLAAAARRTAEALSWERELDVLDASYRDLLGRPINSARASVAA